MKQGATLDPSRKMRSIRVIDLFLFIFVLLLMDLYYKEMQVVSSSHVQESTLFLCFESHHQPLKLDSAFGFFSHGRSFTWPTLSLTWENFFPSVLVDTL